MPQLSAHHVFMSYSRRDAEIIRRTVSFLRSQGITVWLDNENLIPGTPAWEREIEQAIASASAIIAMMSPDSKVSEWVPREINLADQYNKRIFPVLVRGDERSAISLRLTGRQYVDIRQNEQGGLVALSKTLSSYLKGQEVIEQESVVQPTSAVAMGSRQTNAEHPVAAPERVFQESAPLVIAQKVLVEKANKEARASLILGIVSLILFPCLGIFNVIPALITIYYGFRGFSSSRRAEAIGGILLAGASIVISAVWTLYFGYQILLGSPALQP